MRTSKINSDIFINMFSMLSFSFFMRSTRKLRKSLLVSLRMGFISQHWIWIYWLNKILSLLDCFDIDTYSWWKGYVLEFRMSVFSVLSSLIWVKNFPYGPDFPRDFEMMTSNKCGDFFNSRTKDSYSAFWSNPHRSCYFSLAIM